MLLNAADYEIEGLIARGSYGSVFAARAVGGHVVVAAKVFDAQPQSKEAGEAVAREIEILQALQHPNIVRYLGHFVALNKTYMGKLGAAGLALV